MNEVEGEFGICEPLAPIVDHRTFLFDVLKAIGRVTSVVFALVPKDSFEGKGFQRMDHAVVKGDAPGAKGFFTEGKFGDGRRHGDF